MPFTLCSPAHPYFVKELPMKDSVYPSEEQTAYADILFYGCWIGLAIMTITYLLYVFSVITPHVPLERLPEYWAMPVHEYLGKARVPTGWAWTALLGRGDFLNFIGVVLLAGLSIICYVRIIPALIRKNDKIMAFIAIAEVAVLILAASGVINAGAH